MQNLWHFRGSIERREDPQAVIQHNWIIIAAVTMICRSLLVLRAET